ncbi:MAG: WYL domain-containing protein [Burkholderiales bacterium]|nr:WYL domain-containing protein [Burkholderiales bacterium]
MEKENKTSETVRLAIELLRRIPTSRSVSAQELCVQLENAGIKRDIRNIQKQLKMLCQYFDVDCNSDSKPYSYRRGTQTPSFSIPMLNEQDALLLSLAEQHLKNLLPSNLMTSMRGFFEQARAKLDPLAEFKSHTNSSRAREWLGKVRVVSETQSLIPPPIKQGILEPVSNALYFNRWLDVSYKNAAGERKRHDVMPLGLAQQGPRLYLVCRFKGYTNERSLAVHRISSVSTSTLSFDRPKNFKLKEYDADGRFGFGHGKKVHLSFTIDKKAGQHLLESALSKDQIAEELNSGFRINATVVDTGHLRWWLRGFGDKVWDVVGVEL